MLFRMLVNIQGSKRTLACVRVCLLIHLCVSICLLIYKLTDTQAGFTGKNLYPEKIMNSKSYSYACSIAVQQSDYTRTNATDSSYA